jgi:hypothetical protein
LIPHTKTDPAYISSIVPAMPSTNPNYVSIPSNNKTKKNKMHQKFGKGIYAKIAGYKTNAKSGPDNYK